MRQATGTGHQYFRVYYRQGFSQAQSSGQQAFSQQGQLADAQKGLGTFLPQAQRADIQTLGAVGGIQQSQQQAILRRKKTSGSNSDVRTIPKIKCIWFGCNRIDGWYAKLW